MSKIGKKPIHIPEGVAVSLEGDMVTIQGKGGTLSLSRLPEVRVTVAHPLVVVERERDSLEGRANWGTMRALIQNAVAGVHEGFKKTLALEGVGYRAALEGNALVLHLGFSHPITFVPPHGITLGVVKNLITVAGVDKALVGRIAAEIRALKKPEPYKGKGIRYENEVIRRKAGKKVASASK